MPLGEFADLTASGIGDDPNHLLRALIDRELRGLQVRLAEICRRWYSHIDPSSGLRVFNGLRGQQEGFPITRSKSLLLQIFPYILMPSFRQPISETCPDARGYSTVVVDIGLAVQMDALAPLLAHEYHHFYRKSMIQRLATTPQEVSDIVWAVDQLQAEGIADQIDKRDWPDALPTRGPFATYARRYRQHFLGSAGVLKRLNNGLEECARHPAKRQEIGKQIRGAVPLAGHPTGSFMVRLIEEAFGRDICVGTVDNPFAFLRLYSQAAAQTQKAPPFSVVALQVVTEIEEICRTDLKGGMG